MPKTVLVVPTGYGVGLAATSLGLLRALDRSGVSVGFYKPIDQRGDGSDDSAVSLVKSLCGIEAPPLLSLAHLEEELSTGQLDDLMEEVVAIHDDLLKKLLLHLGPLF